MIRQRFPNRILTVRTRRGIAALALLAVLARALIPTGFMPVAGDGAMQLVVCDGTMHHPHAAGGHRGSSDSRDGPCPFAAGAGAGLLPLLAVITPRHARPLAPPFLAGFTLSSAAPLRHTAPRGPPSIV